jgi:hypothetical protein
MLNLSNGNGGAYIRFMAQTKVWENSDKEAITIESMVMDLDSVRTGWLLLAVGQRDWVEDAQVGVKGKQPSPDYKYGFSVKLFSKPTGVVEWCANGVGVTKGFQAIYNACDKAADANPGKVPVIRYEGATSLKIGAGNTSIPNFSLKNWINRPVALDRVDGNEQENPQLDAEYEKQMQTPLPPPLRQAAKPRPAPAPVQQDDEEMFN